MEALTLFALPLFSSGLLFSLLSPALLALPLHFMPGLDTLLTAVVSSISPGTMKSTVDRSRKEELEESQANRPPPPPDPPRPPPPDPPPTLNPPRPPLILLCLALHWRMR